jgi:type VI protein secretion system component Hcp
MPRKKNKVKKENKDTVKIPEKIENINLNFKKIEIKYDQL